MSQLCKHWQRSMSCFVLAFFVCACAVQRIAPSLEDQRTALALVDHGTSDLRAGRLGEAEAAFKVAFELALLPAALDGLGCVAVRRQHLDSAAEFFLAALRLNPQYTQALSNLAYVREEQRRGEEAEILYRKSIELSPANASTRNNYAVFLAERGRSTSAEQEFRSGYILSKSQKIWENLNRAQGEGEQITGLEPNNKS